MNLQTASTEYTYTNTYKHILINTLIVLGIKGLICLLTESELSFMHVVSNANRQQRANKAVVQHLITLLE